MKSFISAKHSSATIPRIMQAHLVDQAEPGGESEVKRGLLCSLWVNNYPSMKGASSYAKKTAFPQETESRVSLYWPARNKSGPGWIDAIGEHRRGGRGGPFHQILRRPSSVYPLSPPLFPSLSLSLSFCRDANFFLSASPVSVQWESWVSDDNIRFISSSTIAPVRFVTILHLPGVMRVLEPFD